MVSCFGSSQEKDTIERLQCIMQVAGGGVGAGVALAQELVENRIEKKRKYL